MLPHLHSTTCAKRSSRLAALLAAGVIAIVGSNATSGASPTPRYTFAETDQGVSVRADGKPAYFFQIATQSLDGKWPRSHYVHPLYDLEGKVLTEDFPKDHGHHRGIFWAWHQLKLRGVPLADPWICKGIRWTAPVGSRLPQLTENWQPAKRHPAVYFSSDADSASLLIVRDWTVDLDGKQTPVVEDRAVITLHAPASETEDVRRIDFAIELRALQPGVTIGGSDDPKGYGGFSTRIAMDPPLTFFGKAGQLEPEVGPVTAGEWLTMRRVAGATSSDDARSRASVSVLCHVANPGHPAPWILRNKRSMQNAAWPGREPVALSVDRATSLKYRLLVHSLPWSAEKLSTEWDAYVAAGSRR